MAAAWPLGFQDPETDATDWKERLLMSMGTLMQGLTASHVATFAEDFGRFLQRGPHSRKQHLVLALARSAGEAERSGDGVRGAFLHGMAAALYGVGRLAEAQELEDIVRPRLEGPDSAAEHVSNQTVSHKEQTMADTMTEFSVQDLAEYLKADGIHYTVEEEHELITASMGLSGLGFVQFRAHVGKNIMAFFYQLPMLVPEHKRVAMTEAIVRINYRLALGGFEMDLEDGELTFRIVVPTDDGTVSLSQYRHCMGASLMTIEHFMPAFLRIIFGGADPNEVSEPRDSEDR